ncbi:putative histidine acid phosphatase [Sclerotinia borealis F-4128]|uniref:Putative histidine acid phosphatase n=1 Tax=Sclerotinia borealis (strain F-4128) TaxID=1432307 RepID=W9C9T0_SCLBF|nr:putative histidine acid phosphatase [Sclerotinia borealis F-4128]
MFFIGDYALFTFLAGSQRTFALSPLESFYPIGLNDTLYISNTSLGSYGGIYYAPGKTISLNVRYGAYDYCSMPHPRIPEYQLPAPIANGSVKAEIVYLEYLQRHQRRTMYNVLPSGEIVPFNCSDVLPYLYAGPHDPSSQQPIKVYAQTYTDPSNPFLGTYVPGTCQYPQLTIGGLLDGYRHGQDLARVYGATGKLSLFPTTPSPETAYFRSSESPLTQQSAGGVLRGIWSSFKGSIPLHQQATSLDTVNAGYSCPAISSTLAEIKSTTEWQAHLTATSTLRTTLGSVFDADSSAWQGTMDHFADNFQARLCNGYSLPCSPTNASNCVTREMADEVFRAGDWEWNYYWRANPYVQKYIQVVEGPFIGEIVSRLERVSNGAIQEGKYSHIFVHDGDIGPVAGALGINALRWPGMGSNIAFEVWKVEDYTKAYCDTYFVRVLYSGKPMESIHGDMDWMPLESLLEILRQFVPKDIVALCNS